MHSVHMTRHELRKPPEFIAATLLLLFVKKIANLETEARSEPDESVHFLKEAI